MAHLIYKLWMCIVQMSMCAVWNVKSEFTKENLIHFSTKLKCFGGLVNDMLPLYFHIIIAINLSFTQKCFYLARPSKSYNQLFPKCSHSAIQQITILFLVIPNSKWLLIYVTRKFQLLGDYLLNFVHDLLYIYKFRSSYLVYKYIR